MSKMLLGQAAPDEGGFVTATGGMSEAISVSAAASIRRGLLAGHEFAPDRRRRDGGVAHLAARLVEGRAESSLTQFLNHSANNTNSANALAQHS